MASLTNQTLNTDYNIFGKCDSKMASLSLLDMDKVIRIKKNIVKMCNDQLQALYYDTDMNSYQKVIEEERMKIHKESTEKNKLKPKKKLIKINMKDKIFKEKKLSDNTFDRPNQGVRSVNSNFFVTGVDQLRLNSDLNENPLNANSCLTTNDHNPLESNLKQRINLKLKLLNQEIVPKAKDSKSLNDTLSSIAVNDSKQHKLSTKILPKIPLPSSLKHNNIKSKFAHSIQNSPITKSISFSKASSPLHDQIFSRCKDLATISTQIEKSFEKNVKDPLDSYMFTRKNKERINNIKSMMTINVDEKSKDGAERMLFLKKIMEEGDYIKNINSNMAYNSQNVMRERMGIVDEQKSYSLDASKKLRRKQDLKMKRDKVVNIVTDTAKRRSLMIKNIDDFFSKGGNM